MRTILSRLMGIPALKTGLRNIGTYGEIDENPLKNKNVHIMFFFVNNLKQLQYFRKRQSRYFNKK